MREQRRRRLITLPHQIDNAATSVTKSSPSTVNDDSHPAPCKMHDTSSKMKASDGGQMMPSSRICYIVVLTLTFYLGGHYCRYSWKCWSVYEEVRITDWQHRQHIGRFSGDDRCAVYLYACHLFLEWRTNCMISGFWILASPGSVTTVTVVVTASSSSMGITQVSKQQSFLL